MMSAELRTTAFHSSLITLHSSFSFALSFACLCAWFVVCASASAQQPAATPTPAPTPLPDNEIFVVDKEYVLVFPRTATGDVAPLRLIRGPNTLLLNARGVIVDPVRNVLLVGTDSGLLVFDRTADADAKPRAIITGPLSGIASSAHSTKLTRECAPSPSPL